jgi:hypothetical protein
MSVGNGMKQIKRLRVQTLLFDMKIAVRSIRLILSIFSMILGIK